MDALESSSDIWQKCARKLSLNSESQLDNLTSTLQSIIQNCLDNPTDEKYFKIKINGKTFQSKIACAEGGIEFLKAINFNSTIIDNEKYLILSKFSKDNLEMSQAWLLTTVSSCFDMKNFHDSKSSSSSSSSKESSSSSSSSTSSCAECIIQIRLPNNTTTTGGFMSHETIHDIQSFAACHFEKGSHVSLRLPNSTASLTEENNHNLDTSNSSNSSSSSSSNGSAITLKEMGLYPRAILIASRVSDEEFESAMSQSIQASKIQKKEEEKNKVIMKVERKQTAEERNKEKRQILTAYKEDREKRAHK